MIVINKNLSSSNLDFSYHSNYTFVVEQKVMMEQMYVGLETRRLADNQLIRDINRMELTVCGTYISSMAQLHDILGVNSLSLYLTRILTQNLFYVPTLILKNIQIDLFSTSRPSINIDVHEKKVYGHISGKYVPLELLQETYDLSDIVDTAPIIHIQVIGPLHQNIKEPFLIHFQLENKC